jgi:hypothetical protein
MRKDFIPIYGDSHASTSIRDVSTGAVLALKLRAFEYVPVLENERHKLFAQQLAQGKTATEAYVLAGFRAHRGNAARLGANERVNARVLEIQAASPSPLKSRSKRSAAS